MKAWKRWSVPALNIVKIDVKIVELYIQAPSTEWILTWSLDSGHTAATGQLIIEPDAGPWPIVFEHCAARIGYNIATTATTQHHNATTPHLHQSGLHGTEHTSAQARFHMKRESGTLLALLCVFWAMMGSNMIVTWWSPLEDIKDHHKSSKKYPKWMLP